MFSLPVLTLNIFEMSVRGKQDTSMSQQFVTSALIGFPFFSFPISPMLYKIPYPQMPHSQAISSCPASLDGRHSAKLSIQLLLRFAFQILFLVLIHCRLWMSDILLLCLTLASREYTPFRVLYIYYCLHEQRF